MSLAIVFYTCLYIHSIHFYTFLFFPAILTPPKKKLQHGAVSTWMQSIWKARKPRIATDQTWIKPVVVSTWFQPRNKHMSLGSFVFLLGESYDPFFDAPACSSCFETLLLGLDNGWHDALIQEITRKSRRGGPGSSTLTPSPLKSVGASTRVTRDSRDLRAGPGFTNFEAATTRIFISYDPS